MSFRSLLFVPGDAPRKMLKALDSDADCVILDLEDAVAPAIKADARREVLQALRGTRARPVAVRINGPQTQWYLEDLVAIVAAAPDYVMLPKCQNRQELAVLHQQLTVLECAHGLVAGAIRVMPLVTESADAMVALDYTASSPRLAALCFGAEDLASDLGIAARSADGQLGLALCHARTSMMFAAAAAGVPAFDTPYPDPRDGAGLRVESDAALALGFAGKLCIHPDQIPTVNASFQPHAATVRWADAVVAAFEANPTAGVLVVDGKMVDKAHLRRAERLRRLSRRVTGSTDER